MCHDLSERKKMILRAVIEAHIQCGEPVGSKFLAENEQIALSSATIRNELADLTDKGYLSKPQQSRVFFHFATFYLQNFRNADGRNFSVISNNANII